jgi:hypothetical protein
LSNADTFYTAAHDAVLRDVIALVKDAPPDDVSAVFAGACAAIFSIVFEAKREQGIVARKAAAETQFWWAGYGAHLMEVNATRPPVPANE